jgi:hypothetical protein
MDIDKLLKRSNIEFKISVALLLGGFILFIVGFVIRL